MTFILQIRMRTTSAICYNYTEVKFMKRDETRAIKIGNLTIGGNNEVIIQSMTNTKTKDIKATVKQINELGCCSTSKSLRKSTCTLIP